MLLLRWSFSTSGRNRLRECRTCAVHHLKSQAKDYQLETMQRCERNVCGTTYRALQRRLEHNERCGHPPLFKEGSEWPQRGDGSGEADLLKSGKILFDRLRRVLEA
jgi:hypothetical protein